MEIIKIMLKENTFSFMIDESSKDFNGFDLKKQIFSGDFKTKKFEWDIAKEEEEKYFLKRGHYIMLTTSPLFLHLTKAQNYVENLLKEPPEDIIIKPNAIAVEEKTPITVSAPVRVRFFM